MNSTTLTGGPKDPVPHDADARVRRLAERAVLAAQAGKVGIWEWDVATGVLVWDERMYALYGRALTAENPSFEVFLQALLPEDRSRMLASIKDALAIGDGLDDEFRINHPAGEVRHIRALATLIRGPQGEAVRMVGTNWDVSDMRAVEAALRASDARARNVIANAGQAIVCTDQSTVVTGWNRHAEIIFGWTATEALGRTFGELIIPSANRAAHLAAVQEFLSREGDAKDLRIEVTAVRKGGVEFPIEIAASAVRGASGWEMTALMQDISGRKAQLQLFETAFSYAAIGMALVGLDGTFLKVNPAICELVGYGERELLALDFQTITHPDDLAADLDLLNQLVAGKISNYQMDKRYIRADGSLIWIQLNVSMVLNQDGSPLHFIAQVQDLTARREAEAALAESETRYRLIAENTTDMIMTTAFDGTTMFAAPSCEGGLGCSPAELVGNCIAAFVHRDDVSKLGQVFASVRDGGPPQRVRWRVKHRSDGRWIWMESNPSLLHDPATGAPAGYLDVVRDVTEQVVQEQALADARAAAEAATAVKSEFLANMSHEIRTPLTAILGFSALLTQHSNLDEGARLQVHRISTASDALLSIVNDVLDFSKLEAGQFEIDVRTACPADVARDALAMFAPQAEAKSLKLTFSADETVPACVEMDPERVRQILLNLIGNAIKFTEIGGVQLSLSFDEPAQSLRFEIEDTGAGLSDGQQRKLFQRFSQVDASTSRKHGGTGLGLAICKGLTEAMGGQIGVRSVLGVGSVFSFDIQAPVASPADQSVLEDEGPRLNGVSVLVVDDNPVNRELTRAVLEAFGVEVTEACDGQSAFDASLGQPFDVILLDVRMPGISGPEALKMIRAQAGPNQHAPILAFTADADIARLGLEHDFDGLVSKPIVPAVLVQELDRWASLERNAGGERGAEAVQSDKARGARV